MTGITSPSWIVRDGYDRLDGVYRDWVAETRAGPRATFPEEILRLLGSNGDALGGAAMHFSSLPSGR